MSASNLVEWVDWQMNDPLSTNDGARKCIMFAVVHCTGATEEEVQTVAVKDGASSEVVGMTIEKLIDVHARGIAAAESATGHESYRVLSFFTGSEGPVGRLPVHRTTGKKALARPGDFVASEPATPAGEMSQGMRHREADHAFVLEGLKGLLRVSQDKDEEVLKLREENREMMSMLMEVARDKVVTAGEAAMKAELIAGIFKLAPGLIHQLSGGRMFQAAASSSVMDILAARLDPHQLEALMTAIAAKLSDEEKAIVAGEWLAAVERVEAKKKKGGGGNESPPTAPVP